MKDAGLHFCTMKEDFLSPLASQEKTSDVILAGLQNEEKI